MTPRRGGHTATVKILLDKCTDVNVKTREDTTPLHGACECGHDAVVSLLIDRGADVYLLRIWARRSTSPSRLGTAPPRRC